MRHCPLKYVNNIYLKDQAMIPSQLMWKIKNRIFTGYQIFVTGEILVFHRCLYNKCCYFVSQLAASWKAGEMTWHWEAGLWVGNSYKNGRINHQKSLKNHSLSYQHFILLEELKFIFTMTWRSINTLSWMGDASPSWQYCWLAFSPHPQI